MTRRWLPWLAMGVVLVVALMIGVADDGGPRTDGDRVRAIAASIKCPTCRSQSVLDSDAPASEAAREEIARQVEAGRTDAEIRAYFVSRYGGEILLNPPRSGVAGMVWVLPVAGLILSLAGLVVAFRRWRTGSGLHATDEDEVLVAQARRRQGQVELEVEP